MKAVRIFDTPIGLIVVISLIPEKQPALSWSAPKSITRPVIVGSLEPFVRSGVIRCK